MAKMVNGQRMPLTGADITAQEARKARFEADAGKRAADKDRLTGQTTAHKVARLAAKFGLTVEELKAALKE